MNLTGINRRSALVAAAGAAAALPIIGGAAFAAQEIGTVSSFRKTPAPDWLLAFWKEIDDKTWGKGFDVFAEDAEGHLGVSDWKGREAIRNNLRQFVDKRMTTFHEVVEFWDGGSLKVFRGFVTMKFDDPNIKTVKPAMTHFFYMDANDPSKVSRWFGSVGPVEF
jgi:hypothetical protein